MSLKRHTVNIITQSVEVYYSTVLKLFFFGKYFIHLTTAMDGFFQLQELAKEFMF